MSNSAAVLNGKDAWIRYQKLLRRVSLFRDRGDHFDRFIGIARDILTSHPIPEKNKDKEDLCVFDNQEVLDTIQDLLETPSIVFNNEFFESPFFPVRLLYEVALFYDVHGIPDEFILLLNLTPNLLSDKKVQTVTWLCSIMCMSVNDTRDVVSRVTSMRSLNASRTAQQNGDRSQKYLATKLEDMDEAATSNVDTSRNRRLENLKHRIRSSSISAFDRMKQTNYITSCLANKQFSGGLTESITLVIHDYKLFSTLYNLDDSAMATNFASCLRDPARVFFLSKVKQGSDFNEIENFMLAEYNSRSRQIKYVASLNQFKLSL